MTARARDHNHGEMTLEEVMRAPSVAVPGVVVVDKVVVEEQRKPVYDMNKDLWVSSADGRHQSPVIPIRVGPDGECFYVHRAILTKEEYFRKALDGHFSEASSQSIDLPEEDPAIFSFLVAWLYEHDFKPLKPASTHIVPDVKGKQKAVSPSPPPTTTRRDSFSESDTNSDRSFRSVNRSRSRSRRRHEAATRRRQRALDTYYEKDITRHRPDCTCATCQEQVQTTACYSCGAPAPRTRGPPPRRFYPDGVPVLPPPQPFMGIGRQPIYVIDDMDRRPRGGRGRGGNRAIQELTPAERMGEEDIRTWVSMFELSVEVYVCAERYLMQSFKECIAAFVTDNLERAGMDAAHPIVLKSCAKLHGATREADEFVRTVLARIGFLLARLWKNFPVETQEWWMENPEVGARVMREMVSRRELDDKEGLPPMLRKKTPERRDHGFHGRHGRHHDEVLVVYD